MKIESYKHTVWTSCAKYIKLRDADKNGWCRCCTCNKAIRYNDSNTQAGHYVPGHNNTTYFDDAFIHVQCYTCNYYGRGEQGKYGLFLKKKYGYDDATLEEVLNRKFANKRVTLVELKEVKKRFDDASNLLRKEKGLK
jgi:hypothetical protein